MAKVFKLSMIGTHNFRKVNAATQMDDKGQYDTMKCTACGIEGKCRDLQTVDVNRMTKQAKHCTMKDAEIKKLEASAQYKSGTKTEHKCPNCKTDLSEIAMYADENTDEIEAEMICTCGHKEFINVTAREKKKPKSPASKRLRKMFENYKKEAAKKTSQKAEEEVDLDMDKILKTEMKCPEIFELQRVLGVVEDGIFRNLTLNALKFRTNKNEISLYKLVLLGYTVKTKILASKIWWSNK